MLQKLKNRKAQSGFTLIELLIVIVIIAILAAIAITAFANAQAQARDSQRKSDIEQIQQALELYYADNGHYPLEADMIDTTTPPYEDTFDGMEKDAFLDPNAADDAVNSFVAGTAAANEYGYAVTQTDGTACTVVENCQSYTLSYYKETADAGKEVIQIEDVSGE